MLLAQNLSFAYGAHQVFENLSLSFAAGQYTALVGPNGSGKSTLFSLLCGSRRPAQGAVLYAKSDVHQMRPRNRAQQFAVVYQQEVAQLPFTCLEVVLMGLHPFRNRFEPLRPEALQSTQHWMEKTGVAHLMNRSFQELSGGEKQRVCITRALVQQPKVLFLDEAMSELDIHARMQMVALIHREVIAQGGMVIAVHHDLSLAYRYADHLVALSEGHIVASGPPHEVMDESFFADVFHVQAEIFPGRGFFLQDSL